MVQNVRLNAAFARFWCILQSQECCKIADFLHQKLPKIGLFSY
jgi:hypothetical protein